MSLVPIRLPHIGITGTIALALGVMTACGQSDTNATAGGTDTTAAAPAMGTSAGSSATVATTPAAASDSAAGADQEFLQKMSDHHAGLILIAHETVDRTGPLAVKDEAKKLDSEQDDGLARMKNALKGEFNVADYKPTVVPEHQAMADSLAKLSGAAYDRQFRMDAIKHHQEGVAMIDQYLPRLTHADVKTMAERMRAAQMKEIDQFKQQLSKS